MVSPLLINLSILSKQPTGLTTYALNVFPHFKALEPTLLIGSAVADFSCYPIPTNMTSDQGSRGHLRRLLWTQFRLPHISRQLKSQLLFSPVPEAPLFGNHRSVVMVHDLIPLRFPKRFAPLTNYARFYVPQVLKQALHIVCNSQATADDIVRFYHIPAQAITPIPLAYDADNFRDLALPTQPYFLYLGRVDPYKNVQRLIQAFAQFACSTPYKLWIAGPEHPRYTPLLRELASELGVGDRIKFLNYVGYTDLPKLLNQAIALVFPSLCEGFGLPALEAMACGTPVITSNLSALPEVVGDAALLVNPYDVNEIRAAMQTIATDTHLRSQLRSASLARACQFSWEKTGQATAEVLRQFL